METAMRCDCEAKPVAATSMEYVAGVSERKRASPRESVVCERWVAEFSWERTTCAAGIAALEESRTSTRSEPRSSWAQSGADAAKRVAAINVRIPQTCKKTGRINQNFK